MSSPRLSNRQHKYNDQLWSTYITEAIQSGNAKVYCANKNIPYATYKLKLAEYSKSEDKENWSTSSKRRYNHRVFTDSTEKAAVEQLTEQYISKQKACNNSDLAGCLLSIHNNKNDVKKCLQVAKLNTVRAQRKSYNKSTVDDTVISAFQQKLIDTLNDFNHKYVMNSDQTRIQQSMSSVYTIHQAGKSAVVNIGINTNPDISATCTVTADGGILPLYFIYPESQVKHAEQCTNSVYH